jgi:hypothetical protein
MSEHTPESGISRRAMLGTMGESGRGFGRPPASTQGRDPSGASSGDGASQRRGRRRPRRRVARKDVPASLGRLR